MENKKGKIWLSFTKALIFSIISIGVYVLSLYIPLGEFDVLGVIRVALTAFISMVAFDAIFDLVRKSITSDPKEKG